MNFNSGAFLIFLPAVVLIHRFLPNKAKRIWLLAASCFFYMYWNPLLILLLAFSTSVDYFCGRAMEKYVECKAKRKLLLLISICMNLSLLFTFKYLDFFADNLNSVFAIFSWSCRLPAFNLILPVGISFYTFQTMSYSIDVYRGDVPAEKDFITFALYVSFFPQLVAGPIESPRNLLPQLKADRKASADDFSVGVKQLISGFFRKCVVADLCGIYVNAVFNNIEGSNALAVAFAGSLFCIQMYCDFAGYSEIAAGSARLMGIRLMRNFDRPYLSQSYAEFFKRWHISLSQWFTRYVFIPLGGSRRGTALKIRNTLIVFILCGFWHGARWTYVLWGLYAASFICLEDLLSKPASSVVQKLHISLDSPLVIVIRRLYMFIIFIPAALLFRAESLSQIKLIAHQLLTADWNLQSALNSMSLNGYSIMGLAITLIGMCAIYRWGSFEPVPSDSETGSAREIAACVMLVIVIALSWFALLSTQDAAGFAYFQF